MCTQADHDQAVASAWSSLLNPRPWPDAELEIAECPHCMSTLAREAPTVRAQVIAEIAAVADPMTLRLLAEVS